MCSLLGLSALLAFRSACFQKCSPSAVLAFRSARLRKCSLSEVLAFGSACFPKCLLSEVLAFRSARFRKFSLSEVLAFRSAHFQKCSLPPPAWLLPVPDLPCPEVHHTQSPAPMVSCVCYKRINQMHSLSSDGWVRQCEKLPPPLQSRNQHDQ